MFKGPRKKYAKAVNGYRSFKSGAETLRHRAWLTAKYGGIAALTAAVLIPAVDQTRHDLSDTPAEDKPGAAADKNNSKGGQGGAAGSKVTLEAGTELYLQPNTDDRQCGYISEPEAVTQVGAPKKGMVLVTTPTGGEGMFDAFVDEPGREDCGARVYVSLGDLATAATKGN
jgi:hypothetical protein